MTEGAVIASAAACAQAFAACVVIPTFDRAGRLVETLAHLERQTRRDFEVIVVDDGSRDDTLARLGAYARTTPLALTVIAQRNAGPAAARNRGIAAARAPVVVLIGDDTYPDAGFVAAHLDFHRDHAEEAAVAVGWTRWCERRRVTPLMRWLERDGVQFAYGGLLAGEPAGWQHFYTSNLSARTGYLRRHPFDTRFAGAAWEDVELGLRLATGPGLAIRFLPAAVVRHDHPVTVRSACARSIGVGEGRRLMAQLWPERFGWRPRGLRRAVRTAMGAPVPRAALVALAAAASAVRCPNPLVRLALSVHDDLGYRRAEQRAARSARIEEAPCPIPEPSPPAAASCRT